MNNCKYSKNETTNCIVHEKCINEELKIHNKIKNNDSVCIGTKCGQYKEKPETVNNK